VYSNLSARDQLPSVHRLRASVDGLCVPGVLSAVVQPLVNLADLNVVGFEALTRVPASPPGAPDWWLERAGELGMRQRLEVACWRAILELGSAPRNALLFVNISPETLAEPDLLALRDQMPERVVIEITEQQAVADYAQVQRDLVPWLSRNVRLAIDDAGAGHSSLRHVIELLPDYVKIDRSLISGIDADRNRTALLHSLVTFAHEVGITVVAEGVETVGELEVVRDAGVDLGQGFLFARPSRIRGDIWPEVALSSTSTEQLDLPRGRPSGDRREREEARLLRRIERASDAKSACVAVVEFLSRRGKLMPSLYLELEGQLRCIAQRGLWQVLDGISGAAGITGKVWSTGQAIVSEDVHESPDYLEAIPGVISEICVPIICDDETIGALNVESLTPLGTDTLELLERCVEVLVARLKVVGWKKHDVAWRRAGRASVEISRLPLEDRTPERAVEFLREAAEMDSVCLLRVRDAGAEVVAASGPLKEILAALPESEIATLSRLVDHVNACYTANESTGRGFLGTESIRAHARAVIVIPLRSGGARIGTVVLAHSRPRALSSDDVEPLELIAGHLAATLDAAEQMRLLRREASRDQLTGLGNRAGLEIGFRFVQESAATTKHATLIIDCDHFKTINDRYGHLAGDGALRSLAQHLSSSAPDLQIFRYGGDEFVCLLPYFDDAEAVASAESLCKSADTALLPYGSSVTAGLALPMTGEVPWATLARADSALLRAKRSSRGTVVLSAVS
jgi:diguanylate cyclase (GGDEF)-like protein